MTYVQELRKRAGDLPLLLVRPTVIITNQQGFILLVKYFDNTWGLPGGLMELGETTEETIKRELKEELNIDIAKFDFYKVFSGKEFYKKSGSGAETYYTAIVYRADAPGGEIKPDNEEVAEYGFFDPFRIPESTTPIDQVVIKEYRSKRL